MKRSLTSVLVAILGAALCIQGALAEGGGSSPVWPNNRKCITDHTRQWQTDCGSNCDNQDCSLYEASYVHCEENNPLSNCTGTSASSVLVTIKPGYCTQSGFGCGCLRNENPTSETSMVLAGCG